MNKKLFFFGIDSATWDLIIPWVKQGKLPGFAKFIKQGLTTDLYSTTPPLTPIAWSTLYTGVNPGKHGLFGFYRFDKKKQITINLAFDRKLPTMFNLLSKAGLKVASLNMPFTFPVEPVNGIMLSGFLTPDLKANYIYPKELGKRFAKIFPNHSFTEKSRYGMDKKSLFWWYGHKLIETDREQNFHDRKHVEIRQEGQGRE